MRFWKRPKVSQSGLLALQIAQVLANQRQILDGQTKLLNQGGYILTTLTDVRNVIGAIKMQVQVIAENHNTASAQEDADLAIIVADLQSVSAALAALIPPVPAAPIVQ